MSWRRISNSTFILCVSTIFAQMVVHTIAAPSNQPLGSSCAEIYPAGIGCLERLPSELDWPSAAEDYDWGKASNAKRGGRTSEEDEGQLSSQVVENTDSHKHVFEARGTTITLYHGQTATLHWTLPTITSIQTSTATSKSVSVRTQTVSVTQPTTVTAVPTSIKTVTAISNRLSVATQVITSVATTTVISEVAEESGYQGWEDLPPAAEETPFPSKNSEASGYQVWEYVRPATTEAANPDDSLSFKTQFVTLVKTITVTSENCATSAYQSWDAVLRGEEQSIAPRSPSSTG